MTTAGDRPPQRSLPAWSLPAAARREIRLDAAWPEHVTREWAWDGSSGESVRVCLIDSGVDWTHPRVGASAGGVVVSPRDGGDPVVETDDEGDVCGHGTACASVIRSLAPACELHSVRVLGSGSSGSGDVLIAGIRWAIEQQFDVVNLSLSTTKNELATILHELADDAYFQRTVLVASAHNMPVVSYPWRFSSVISVGSHEEADPFAYFYNPNPPVEFFARGVGLEVAWYGGGTARVTGNSFATPHITGIAALILAKHRWLTPFQLKSVLYLTSLNVAEAA